MLDFGFLLAIAISAHSHRRMLTFLILRRSDSERNENIFDTNRGESNTSVAAGKFNHLTPLSLSRKDVHLGRHVCLSDFIDFNFLLLRSAQQRRKGSLRIFCSFIYCFVGQACNFLYFHLNYRPITDGLDRSPRLKGTFRSTRNIDILLRCAIKKDCLWLAITSRP